MSLQSLRDRLRYAREDDRVTRAEVDSFIRSAMQDGNVNFQEALILRGELDANGALFEPDAYDALKTFLDQNEPKV